MSKWLDLLEYARWGESGPKCPTCGSNTISSVRNSRPGQYRCATCKSEYSVRTGTQLAGSNLDDFLWVTAFSALHTNPRTSSVDLAKLLSVTQKTAWNVLQRIAASADDFPHASALPAALGRISLSQDLINQNGLSPAFQTDLGILYQGDCIDAMRQIPDESVDCFFADPPFNLNKDYGAHVNDSLPEEEYELWMRKWLDEAVRVLSPGGAMWVYNLPRWNIPAGAYLMTNKELTFKHQVAISMKSSLPIPNKLYPAHYSLLYFIKGKKPRHFIRPRIPIEVCRHCGKEIKDYGGHRSKMNPDGVNLSDVWTDLSPVRHKKTKYRAANALPEKMLERILEISTEAGDLVLDPFGGSGTTYAVAERMKRHWIGIELGSVEPIIARLKGEKIDFAMPNAGDAAPGRGQKKDAEEHVK